jgi:glycolate oxidase FAD binding subunit
MGTLGALLEISLKVLPRPAYEDTVVQTIEPTPAIAQMNKWAGLPLPISATAYMDGKLYVRLSGAKNAVDAARKLIGGELYKNQAEFWHQLREHRLDFFSRAKTLWRISVPPTTAVIALAGEWVMEWGGGLRWLATDENPQRIFEAVNACGGHAVLFRGGDRDGAIFQTQDKNLHILHKNLKHAFDPHSIFNPGRMYRDI